MSDTSDQQQRLDRQEEQISALKRIIAHQSNQLRATRQQHDKNLNELKQQHTDNLADLRVALEKAKAANQAKTAFLAQMSHEVRTPLHGLLGTIDVLSRTQLSAEQHTLMTTAKESGSHLMRVIGDILDFSRLEEGHLQLEELPVDIDDLADSLISMFSATASQKDLRLILRIPAKTPFIRADAHRIRQVLANLLNNAVKFTQAGKITFGIAFQRVSDSQVKLQWSVTDTGIGIPPERLQDIFEPFTQAEKATTRQFGGTGLGLAISKRLVAAMGGDLTVISRPGQGSTFAFETVHTTVEHLHAPTAQPDNLQMSSSLTILLVDDHPVNRTLGKAMLSKLGCDVFLAEDGPSAIEQAHAVQPDLIFMDCHMPGMSGEEATIQLRQQGLTIPIVALTADVSPESIERIKQAGMQDLLGKPYTLSQLSKMLFDAFVLSAEVSFQPQTMPTRIVTGDSRPLLDKAAMHEAVAGDQEQINMLYKIFLEQLPHSIQQLNAAVNHKHLNGQRQAAHALKGAASAIGALRLYDISHDLEQSRAMQSALCDEVILVAKDTAALIHQHLKT